MINYEILSEFVRIPLPDIHGRAEAYFSHVSKVGARETLVRDFVTNVEEVRSVYRNAYTAYLVMDNKVSCEIAHVYALEIALSFAENTGITQLK